MNKWNREKNRMESGMIHSIPGWNESFHILPQEIKIINLGRMKIIHSIPMQQLNTIFFIV